MEQTRKTMIFSENWRKGTGRDPPSGFRSLAMMSGARVRDQAISRPNLRQKNRKSNGKIKKKMNILEKFGKILRWFCHFDTPLVCVRF